MGEICSEMQKIRANSEHFRAVSVLLPQNAIPPPLRKAEGVAYFLTIAGQSSNGLLGFSVKVQAFSYFFIVPFGVGVGSCNKESNYQSGFTLAMELFCA